MGNLLDPDQAAERLNISRRTLDKWRNQRRGPSYRKLGTANNAPIRYDEDDLTAWVKNQTVDPSGGDA